MLENDGGVVLVEGVTDEGERVTHVLDPNIERVLAQVIGEDEKTRGTVYTGDVGPRHELLTSFAASEEAAVLLNEEMEAAGAVKVRGEGDSLRPGGWNPMYGRGYDNINWN